MREAEKQGLIRKTGKKVSSERQGRMVDVHESLVYKGTGARECGDGDGPGGERPRRPG